MSTDHQQYSIVNQSAALALYAAAHGIGIIRSFVDEGKSGTTIKGRTGLQALLRLVESGRADFGLILVYDVSRFGRFPDSDEAAFYEYSCKRAGIQVLYCAEQFENDNSTASNLLKALKRTMAGEFSRDLSVKVFAAQCRLAQLGFRMGGPAAYGLRRLLVDKDFKVKKVLGPGEYKGRQTDRTILVLGDAEEIKTVHRIFNLFTRNKMKTVEIAKKLNEEGLPFRGHAWERQNINYLLQNPAYIGTNAFCRVKAVPGGLKKTISEENWSKRERAFPAIIQPQQFHAAQAIMRANKERFSEATMLAALRRLWKRKGTLNSDIIDHAAKMPGLTTLRSHFGGLHSAYRLIGFKPKIDNSGPGNRKSLNPQRDELLRDIAAQIQQAGGSVRPGPLECILINEGITVRLKLSRPREKCSHMVWPLRLSGKRIDDILIIARLEPTATFKTLDYYVIPRIAKLRGDFCICTRPHFYFMDIYRTDNLKPFIESFGRILIPGAA